jgi:hypothetical protein
MILLLQDLFLAFLARKYLHLAGKYFSEQHLSPSTPQAFFKTSLAKAVLAVLLHRDLVNLSNLFSRFAFLPSFFSSLPV